MSKKPLVVTPMGRAIYPHLNNPDTKFDDDGVYHVKLAIETSKAQSLIDQLTEAHAASVAEAKKEGKKKVNEADFPFEQNPENDAETIFKFKSNASFKDKKTGETVRIRPALYDAKAKTFPVETRIGGGSILRVSFEIVPYFMDSTKSAGISLRMKGVQVIDLKAGGRSAESLGFSQEEGYEVETPGAEFAAAETTAPAAGAQSGADF